MRSERDGPAPRQGALCVYPQAGPTVRASAFQVGCVAYLNALAQRQRFLSCGQLQRLAQEAVRHKHIRLYFHDGGAPAGYLIWAFVTADVWRRMRRQPRFQLHASEWNEGELPCIVDVLAPRGQLDRYVADFAGAHGLDPDSILNRLGRVATPVTAQAGA